MRAVSSQMAAFQAVDQKILARRVGGAPGKIEPIPLNFDKKLPILPPPPDDDDSTADSKDAGEDETPDEAGGEAESAMAPSESGDARTPAEEKTATVSHVLTNTIVLQSFLFELASLIQVRAGLFDEVRFV